MKLSVITINRDNLVGLQRTVESVVSQTWREFEYILVDGASSDGSAEYLADNVDLFDYSESEPDNGVYHAMNKGIKQAHGEYLLFLNSGDVLANDTILEELIPLLGGEGIIYGDLILIQQDGKQEIKKYPDQLSWNYVRDHSLPHPATFIRRNLFDLAGLYNEDDRISSDWQFFMRVLFFFSVSYLHVNHSISIFGLDGMCNDPANLKETLKEKKRFLKVWKKQIGFTIFFVGMADSIHVVRWLEQLQVEGYSLILFPSYDVGSIHSDLPDNVKLCIPFYWLYKRLKSIGKANYYWRINRLLTKLQKRIRTDYYSRRLSKKIKSWKPNLIHSLETQGGGYLVASAKKCFSIDDHFPVWWHSNWGSDIYLFGRIPEHIEQITEVMSQCDYYSCECERDVKLAKEFGFHGKVFPVYPNSGGLRAELVENLRHETKIPSKRKLIMLKGYQGWAGRALVGLHALERCADVLEEYEVVVYTNTQAKDIQIAADLFVNKTKVKINLLPIDTSQNNILRYHGKARISIGLSISDGISTSLLEAMAMGSFPIQSCTACANEWISDGLTGFIVPAEDPEVIEMAIRKALSDNHLVDQASELNRTLIKERADFDRLKKISRTSYNTVFTDHRK